MIFKTWCKRYGPPLARRLQTVKKLIHCERKGTVQYFGLWPKPPPASGYLSGTVQYFGLWPKPPSASGYLSGTWERRDSWVYSAGGIHFRRGKSRISAPWQSSGLFAEIGIYCLNLNSKKSRRTFSTHKNDPAKCAGPFVFDKAGMEMLWLISLSSFSLLQT